jgi:hypothetical protein
MVGAWGGGAGAAVGLIIGSLVRTERWEPAPFKNRGTIAVWRGGGARAYGIGFRYAIM